jgi:CheY-like chemotaxis protein
VLLNLLGNAIKFTERGGVTVTVEPDATNTILFRVQDTGIGIAPDAQARVFEEFEQASSGAARQFGGTGLGLAISRRIVERMGGALTLTSTPGEGSTFAFTAVLPAVRTQDIATAPRLAGTRVLIAAPTDIEAALVARHLMAWGAEAHVVASVDHACAELAGHHWNAVMVDAAFGIPAATAIADACSQTVTRRLILITPQARSELAAFKDAGYFGYLVKPVRAASLAARFGAEHANLSGTLAANAAAGDGPGLSVLVAEDNEINAFLARALLQRLGHRPTIVGNGQEAAEQFEAAHAAGTPFDLVLMDVHMPGVDGMTATRMMRAAEARRGGRHTRIVALTADVTASDRDACLAAGMDGFLTKPLDRERLIETIAAIRNAALAA